MAFRLQNTRLRWSLSILTLSFLLQCNTMHIVFVLADDLGYADPHFTNGYSNINTPTIELYANKGIILDNYYVQPICTPTRSALMSGMYPIHIGLQDKVIRDSVPEALPLINPRPEAKNNNIITMPQYLKQHGNYETHMIGKWHLGFYQRKYTPQERGFDHFYGYYTGNEEYWNHTSPCWHCGNYTAIDLGYHNSTADIWDLNKGGIYSTNLFAQHAVDVIHKFGEDHVKYFNMNSRFLSPVKFFFLLLHSQMMGSLCFCIYHLKQYMVQPVAILIVIIHMVIYYKHLHIMLISNRKLIIQIEGYLVEC